MSVSPLTAAGNTIGDSIEGGLHVKPDQIELGSRPLSLVTQMRDGALRQQLQACANGPFKRSDFSIGHRGAPLEFAEHTRESYIAAARQGAGMIECDVTFTSDRELVCRHSQCDLHRTTNILELPDLAKKCSEPFRSAIYDPKTGIELSGASARCCASDITLEEFRRLRGKQDSVFAGATSVRDFLYGPDADNTVLNATGTLLTHRESIELFKELGVQMVPELKTPEIEMSTVFTQRDYARKMLDEYSAAGVPPSQVWPQSFSLADILFWLEEYPEFTRRLIYLDDRYRDASFDHSNPASWEPAMEQLAASGVRIIAPPIWMLVTASGADIVPSVYAQKAREAGLDIITWSLERSGSLSNGGGWYYRSITPLIDSDGDVMELLSVLAEDVGVRGVFSDWPATVTYFANCTGLP
jgi:glycerophosphoryl diester phosphodiesterase